MHSGPNCKELRGVRKNLPVKRACVECRKKHAACDNRKPSCTNCAKRRLNCVRNNERLVSFVDCYKEIAACYETGSDSEEEDPSRNLRVASPQEGAKEYEYEIEPVKYEDENIAKLLTNDSLSYCYYYSVGTPIEFPSQLFENEDFNCKYRYSLDEFFPRVENFT